MQEAADEHRFRFNGSDYDRREDDARLASQLDRVFELMKDGQWRTLQEIAVATHDPPASVSAQLRHLRKPRFGGHTVNKQTRGERDKGLFEYQLLLNESQLFSLMQFEGDEAVQRKFVDSKTWQEVYLAMTRKGYRYLGDGKWRKK